MPNPWDEPLIEMNCELMAMWKPGNAIAVGSNGLFSFGGSTPPGMGQILLSFVQACWERCKKHPEFAEAVRKARAPFEQLAQSVGHTEIIPLMDSLYDVDRKRAVFFRKYENNLVLMIHQKQLGKASCHAFVLHWMRRKTLGKWSYRHRQSKAQTVPEHGIADRARMTKKFEKKIQPFQEFTNFKGQKDTPLKTMPNPWNKDFCIYDACGSVGHEIAPLIRRDCKVHDMLDRILIVAKAAKSFRGIGDRLKDQAHQIFVILLEQKDSNDDGHAIGIELLGIEEHVSTVHLFDPNIGEFILRTNEAEAASFFKDLFELLGYKFDTWSLCPVLYK